MPKKIDSDALGELQRSLGLTGQGAQVTELNDGTVDQVMAINEVARRGRTLAATSGIFTPTMRTNHSGATDENVIVDPYNVGTTGVVAPYPAVMPLQFDVWLMGASIRQVSGAGTLTATLSLVQGTRQAGWGLDEAGAQVLVAQPIRLAFWNAVSNVLTKFGTLQGPLGPHWSGPVRLNRFGMDLRFDARSSEAAAFDCQLILGVFPAGLGQDVR